MSPRISYASYLLRLWRTAKGSSPLLAQDWEGEVDHLQSGQRWTFAGLDQLIEILAQERLQAGDSGSKRSPDLKEEDQNEKAHLSRRRL